MPSTQTREVESSHDGNDNGGAGVAQPATVSSVVQGEYGGITLDRPRLIVDVNLILVRDGRILLGRRCNTDFGEGCYNPPAGHLELGESVVDALIREAKEELDITIAPEDVRFVQAHHNAYGIGRIAFFFEVKRWSGKVTNMEPHKCDDLDWFSPDALPDQLMPHIRRALDGYRKSEAFSLYGW